MFYYNKYKHKHNYTKALFKNSKNKKINGGMHLTQVATTCSSCYMMYAEHNLRCWKNTNNSQAETEMPLR